MKREMKVASKDKNEDIKVIVSHGGASGSEETITVTIEFEVLE